MCQCVFETVLVVFVCLLCVSVCVCCVCLCGNHLHEPLASELKTTVFYQDSQVFATYDTFIHTLVF